MRCIGLAALLLAVAATTAQAGSIATPPLLSDPGVSALCAVVNANTKGSTINVTVSIFNGNGVLLNSQSCPTLAMGTSCQAQASAGAQLVYCTMKIPPAWYLSVAHLNLMLVDASGLVTSSMPGRFED